MILNSRNNPQLQVEGVSLAAPVGLSYLLQNISFEVFSGERIAIIGPSGAGKTSLLRLLNRLSEPTKGSIYLEERDIRKIPAIQLRQQVTLLMQEAKLLGMTVREAIAYPLVLRRLEQQQIQERLAYWIEQLRIPQDWLGRTEVQLSAGQRQLVAYARALVIQPKILLLDEPTSALDVGRASFVLNLLQQLQEREQTTILMVNQQLEQAQQFCTRVLRLQQGQLVQDLPATQVDWLQLRATLIELERLAAQEWE
ncbi:ABC transporter-like protein [Microseira wollei NIES-4236]|uniref:ABC transporter-like protein n=1 Tax=Microseira wollei NIES-4236 TaxID=2530354 RepID=A0AAV3XD89_9CYAN|nr:ABC transporter-like protein [Microseira wollei NIES-4236]